MLTTFEENLLPNCYFSRLKNCVYIAMKIDTAEVFRNLDKEITPLCTKRFTDWVLH